MTSSQPSRPIVAVQQRSLWSGSPEIEEVSAFDEDSHTCKTQAILQRRFDSLQGLQPCWPQLRQRCGSP